MLTITKTPPPVELAILKQAQRKAGLEPRYHHLQGNDKIAVQKALLEEQGYLYAYCMKLVKGKLKKFREKRPDEDGNFKFKEYCGIVLYFLRKRLDRMK